MVVCRVKRAHFVSTVSRSYIFILFWKSRYSKKSANCNGLGLFISVDGGWREESASECSEVCGEGIIRKLKYCDDPTPTGGDFCPCNSTNPYEVECDGIYAVIEEPCNEGPCESKFFFSCIII